MQWYAGSPHYISDQCLRITQVIDMQDKYNDARLNNSELNVITHFIRGKPEYGENKYWDGSCD
jgi:hypothetical protein